MLLYTKILINFYNPTGATVRVGSWHGPGTGPIHLDEVYCIGSENALTSCSFSYFGDVSSNCRSHLEDASVICSSGILNNHSLICLQ